MMPLADILNEIDAYLSCLRRAREILSAPTQEARHRRASHAKKNIKVRKTALAVSSESGELPTKFQANSLASHRTMAEQPVDAFSHVRRATEHEQPPTATPGTRRRVIESEAISLDRSRLEVGSGHRKPTQRAIGNKVEIKPAIALAKSTAPRIVVVSAAEAKRERESAAPFQVRQPRVPLAGLKGKLAFEALFKE